LTYLTNNLLSPLAAISEKVIFNSSALKFQASDYIYSFLLIALLGVMFYGLKSSIEKLNDYMADHRKQVVDGLRLNLKIIDALEERISDLENKSAAKKHEFTDKQRAELLNGLILEGFSAIEVVYIWKGEREYATAFAAILNELGCKNVTIRKAYGTLYAYEDFTVSSSNEGENKKIAESLRRAGLAVETVHRKDFLPGKLEIIIGRMV
jgi:hypothetical protein